MREIRPRYWQLRVSLGRDPVSKRPTYRTRGLRGSKRDATRALAGLVAEVLAERDAASTVTVNDLLTSWLAHLEAVGRSPSTIRGYRSLRRLVPEQLAALPIDAVSVRTLDELYRELTAAGRGPATVHNLHAMLRAALSQAVAWEQLDSNPARLARPPRSPRRGVKPPTVDTVKAVIAAATASPTPMYGLVFGFLASTGCRRGEVCAFRWRDLNPEFTTARIRRAVLQADGLVVAPTKTHQRRAVTLTPTITRGLRRHRDGLADRGGLGVAKHSYVFSLAGDQTVPLDPDLVSRRWRRYADEVGTTARLHDLRHFQASVLLDAGEPVTTVAHRLGHANTSTTLDIYAHLAPGADERAAEIIERALADPDDTEPDPRPARDD